MHHGINNTWTGTEFGKNVMYTRESVTNSDRDLIGHVIT